jgi:hypothetical protein
MAKKSAAKAPPMPGAPEPRPPEQATIPPDLIEIDVSKLETFANSCDLGRDLHVFASYVAGRDIKRMHRSNALPKADSLRLAKAMSDSEAVSEVEQDGSSVWVDFVDAVALDLGLVTYDTKGTYAGYSSVEPSYPDNYIEFNEQQYQRFRELAPSAQESRILDILLASTHQSDNEFYQTSILGRLAGFSSFGCAIGVMPTLDFARIRRFLFSVLLFCQPGVWYSTASLVRYLKTAYPYFLIPRDPKVIQYHRGTNVRYGNFCEGKSEWDSSIQIQDGDPDGFERVEGRYVERFLEYIPLLMRYVEVAYAPGEHQDIYPERDLLQAFRTTARLRRALAGEAVAPRVTVQPNFEVYVESEFYPAGILAQLAPFTDLISSDVVTILRLRREKTAAQLAQDDSVDLAALLEQLSGRELPQNVARELAEWRGHAATFTLYDGFALLESDAALPEAEPYTVEHVAPNLRIVRDAPEVNARLEKAGLVPLWIEHPAGRLASPPAPAVSVLRSRVAPPEPAKAPTPSKPTLTVTRQTMVTLRFSDPAALDACAKVLLDARCPVEVNRAAATLTYAGRYQGQIDKALQKLGESYLVTLSDEG